MRPRYLVLFFVFFQLSCHPQQAKYNGVSFVASREPIDSSHVAPVININSNAVALMPFGFIRDINSPEITHNSKRQWFGETEAGLRQYASVCKEKELQIMVKPQLWVWRGTYTGYIEMDTEEKWEQLENSYRSFILTYAKVAHEIDAELFCIGTELEKFVMARPNYWRNLIKEIQSVYKGKLTYAANWDEYKRVSFWNQLDYIGIDAYFPISDAKTPSLSELELGWKPYKEEIKSIKAKFDKPVLFTEFGYRSIDYTAKAPWESKRVEGMVNLKGQENAMQALHNQFWKEEWFAGGFVWKWFHKHDRVGGLQNNQFTPQNKPVERLISKLYAEIGF